MKEIILFLAQIVDFFHDALMAMSQAFGLNMTDKELHFWIIGILGIISFLCIDRLFHAVSQYSITVLSFIYTFTMVLVFVFALEIQQGVTGSGNMEFDDAAIGIVGFFAFLGVYTLIRLIAFGLKKWINRRKSISS
ncbi:hypothetical protein ACFFGV_07285 [Pontibacillus salicampi]|uniref:Uncharacterized protein n=1 Tax=Pontibacillus salicampi TaxID=1449801 RepID=A0ABV6LLV0_9BACI